jgi:3',5'-nucleoside bisphosphate phosphatase
VPQDAPTFDLQSHSRCSDGNLSPAEVVSAAAAAGVELLALTDHDTVDGVEEAAGAAASAGLHLVPAVEISAVAPGRHAVHILGYRIDHGNPELRRWLEHSRHARQQRAAAIAAALRELGFELDEQLLRERADGGSVGRPHLAEAVLAAPGNRDRLRAEGIEDSGAFLEAYLVPGRPGFRPRAAPATSEVITMIHTAGGVAVWAHPFWDIVDPPETLAMIDSLVAEGLDGVECFYPSHDRAHTELLGDRCEALGLLTTGSADFHGPEHREFSRFRAFSTYGRTPVLGPIAP